MKTYEIIFWIISILLSAATLCAMLFGFRLGKKALTRNFTLYGEQAKKELAFLKEKTLKGATPEKYIYEGRKVITPQLKVEKITFDPQTMSRDWKKYTRLFRYYDTDKENPNGIQVEEWRV